MGSIGVTSATAACLASTFESIHAERMRDLPILNPRLAVEVVEGDPLGGDWIGVLITPWCMNLVLIPGPQSSRRLGGIGAVERVTFPAGQFDLSASEEAGLGRFAACSLFSPMGEFADQASAVATAEAFLVALDAPEPARPSTRPTSGISRRELLRGAFRARR